jgi:hypothetical protein
MAEAHETASMPYQPGVLGWYCPWCNHANLTRVPGSDAQRLRIPASLRRLEVTELSCANCNRAVRLIDG